MNIKQLVPPLRLPRIVMCALPVSHGRELAALRHEKANHYRSGPGSKPVTWVTEGLGYTGLCAWLMQVRHARN